MTTMESITYSLASLGTFSGLPQGILMDLAEALRLLREAEAAGFITEDAQVRKVLGTLPLMADGCVIGNLGKVWTPGGSASGYCMAEDKDETHWVPLECYSTPEAARAAKENA